MSGQVIWQQISIGTKMACGARKAVAGEGYLHFNVGGSHSEKIVVKLNVWDTYDVELVKCSRKSADHKVLESHEGIYCDQLSEVIYHMVNK